MSADQTLARAMAHASMLATKRCIDALLRGLREQGEPTLNAVVALSELLDEWMLLLASDAVRNSKALDAHAHVVHTLKRIVAALAERIEKIEHQQTKLERSGHSASN